MLKLAMNWLILNVRHVLVRSHKVILQYILKGIKLKLINILFCWAKYSSISRNGNTIIICMSIQIPKTIKNIIRHQETKEKTRPANIFQNCQAQESVWNANKTFYSIVGDLQFKQNFHYDKANNDKTLTVEKQKQSVSLHETYFNTTFCNMTRTIEDGTLTGKLSKDKQLQLSRHRRTFMEFQNVQKRDERVNLHLKKRLSHFGTRAVSNTITFQRQQIQTYPNPQLIELINGNIPEYWKNSLRDNQKRLKRHVKGNNFKSQVAEEMLQTLKGRKRLVQSIPKIKDEFLPPFCSKTKEVKQKKFYRFSVKGNSPLNSTNRSQSESKNVMSIPDIKFQQIYKIKYDSSHRWLASQLC